LITVKSYDAEHAAGRAPSTRDEPRDFPAPRLQRPNFSAVCCDRQMHMQFTSQRAAGTRPRRQVMPTLSFLFPGAQGQANVYRVVSTLSRLQLLVTAI
jgi:hypothetical protein